MKRILILSVMVALAAPSQASPLFYDGFNYTAGELLAPVNDTTGSPNPGQLNVDYGVNWRYAGAGAAVNAPPGMASGGLSYPDLAPSTGNSVLFDMTKLGSARIQVTPAAISSDTVYWSGLLQVNSIGTLTTGANGMLLGGFNNTAGAGTLPTTVNAVLRIRQDTSDPTAYHIGTAMNSGTAAGNIQFDNVTPYAAGQTVFVVGSYEFVAGTFNDVARMWINPNSADFGAASPPSATLTSVPGGSAAELTSVLTFNLRNVNSVGLPTLQFDELRVGTTWADVTPVPEPAATGLLGLGMLAVVGWYRLRKR